MPEKIRGEVSSAAPPAVVLGAGISARPELLVPIDTVLAGRYTVNGAFPVRSRLSETYLCTWRQRPYVAKVYEEGSGFDKAAANLLMQLNSPYLVRVIKAARFEDHPFTITPYYRNGSLEGRTFDADVISREIVPQLNRGLNALHTRGIVHGHLTPSNVMIGDDSSQYLISDFSTGLAGDSEVTELEQTVSGTDGPVSYQAPETQTGPPIEASDYYSLGILLFVLFTGQLPVEQPRSFDALAPRFDYPADMPARLRDLIIGLTHTDLANQNNPANPNRRWTYNEVRRWCAGDTIPVPIEGFGPGATILPYVFEGRQYTSLGALAAAMAVNWTSGKKHLLTGTLSKFFAATDPATSKICDRAETLAKRHPERENAIYLETLNRLSPDLDGLYWQNDYIGTPQEVGEIFETGKVTPQLDEMTQQGALSGFLRAKFPEAPQRARTMAWAENSFVDSADNPQARAVAMMVMARILTGDYQYTVDGDNFDDLPEFAAFCLELRADDREAWDKLADSLVLGPGRLAPAFEAWLLALGHADAISAWAVGRAGVSKVEPGSALRPAPDPGDEWIV